MAANKANAASLNPLTMVIPEPARNAQPVQFKPLVEAGEQPVDLILVDGTARQLRSVQQFVI